MSRSSTAGLARMSARHPWRVLTLWILALAIGLVAASGLSDAVSSTGQFTGKPESQRGADLLSQRLRGPRRAIESVLVTSPTRTVDDPAFKDVVAKTTRDLRALPRIVQSVTNADESGNRALIAADRHTMLLPVTLVESYNDAYNSKGDTATTYLDTIEREGAPGIRVLTAGDLSMNEQFNDTAAHDLANAETIGLPAALLVLIVVFGALIAAGIPLALALVAIVIAMGLATGLAQVLDLSFYVTNMITMIGMAVGIDYSLFIVERYREERRHGAASPAAIARAGATASKAVLFSGTTVMLALLGMFLVPLPIFRGIGAGAILVVIVAVVAALTLIPALLSLLGDKIDWPRRRRAKTRASGVWGTIAHVVMARPVASVVIATAVLVLAALPYAGIHRGTNGIDTLPAGEVRTAYQLLARDFPAGVIAPVEIVVDGKASDPAVQTGITRLSTTLQHDADFGPVTTTINRAGDLTLLSAPLTMAPDSAAATAAVNRLRHELIPAAFGHDPARVLVTGGPAMTVDLNRIVDHATRPVFAFVLGLSFLLLLLAFRSLVVAAKAIVMNLLSVGAAYGLMVLVFQKGYLHTLFGFQRTSTIESWIPIFLFCVLFGLSMDYHVFLLSRIREHYDLTRRNAESVAAGLQATGKIITGAAAIMVIVFATFATGQLVAFQQLGFGLAVAILIDATLVRSLLVPAAMALLGDWNWYLPRWLHWLPDLRIERSDAPASVASDPEPVAAD